MTEIENQIPFSGIDPKGRLKFGVLLEMFQEMADIDASKFNLSVRQTLEHDVTWVFRKYRIDLEKYPTKMDEKIRIKTYAEPTATLLPPFVQAVERRGRFSWLRLYLVGTAGP